MILLFLGGFDACGTGATVVLLHAVFPLEEFGDGLGLDADFHATQAGQQQIHLIGQAGRRCGGRGRSDA